MNFSPPIRCETELTVFAFTPEQPRSGLDVPLSGVLIEVGRRLVPRPRDNRQGTKLNSEGTAKIYIGEGLERLLVLWVW